jgi:hypothetical protein
MVSRGKTYYFINGKLIESNYVIDQFYVENQHNIYFTTTWIYEKRVQLWGRLAIVTHILVRKLLYKQGYMVVRGAYWLNILNGHEIPNIIVFIENIIIDTSSEFQNMRHIRVNHQEWKNLYVIRH